MRYISLVWALMLGGLVLFFTGSCVPDFKNPLPRPKDSRPDERILGTWISPDEVKNKAQVSFFARKTGLMDIVDIYDIDGISSKDGVNVSIYEGYTTSVNQDKFVCFRARRKDMRGQEKKKQEFNYWIAYYEISEKDILSIHLFDLNAVRALVENKKLKGEIIKGKTFDQGRSAAHRGRRTTLRSPPA